MSLLDAIKGQNESKINNSNFEKILLNNRKRKLQEDNYIIVIYNQDVEYSNGFSNRYRKINKIVYNNLEYASTQPLSIIANQEIQIYVNEETISLEGFFYFYYDLNAQKIKLVDFSHFSSSLKTNMNYLFNGCSSLQNINFLNFDTSKVETMDGVFKGCTSLSSLDLSSFDTSSVSSMMSMFQNCENLESLKLSSFVTSKVKIMENMFSGCKFYYL